MKHRRGPIIREFLSPLINGERDFIESRNIFDRVDQIDDLRNLDALGRLIAVAIHVIAGECRSTLPGIHVAVGRPMQ